jgi:hypothetical protein
MLIKVISGGQRGSDQGGLAAAKDNGLATGGWAPKGWITQNGPNPLLAKLGLKEHGSSKYPPRTYANVKDSDGTIRLAKDFNSPGEVCTLKAINFYNKPWLDIDLSDLTFIFDVTDWIDKNGIKVLNVAGNAGKTNEEGTLIFQTVRQYLGCIFRHYKKE